MRKAFLTAAILAAIALPATAQAPSGDRYLLEKTDEGDYLRLDKQTGNMSLCRSEEGNWSCRAVADDRVAFEDEIERLGDEIASLRDRLRDAGETARNNVELPSREDMDKVMGFMEDTFTRFKGMVDRLNEEPPTPEKAVPEDPASPDRT